MMAAIAIIRDVFAVIGFASVMCSLSIVVIASIGAWFDIKEEDVR